jgi:quercetin dioxygenase-like cupin family protein
MGEIKTEKEKWMEKKQGYFKNVLLKGKEIGEDGTVFQKVRFPSGLKIGPHYHKKQTEIFYVTKGNAILEIAGEKFKANTGKAFIVKPGDFHLIDNTNGKEDFEMIIFKINEPRENDFFEKRGD